MRFGDGLELGVGQSADLLGLGLGFRTGLKMCHSARARTKESSAVLVSRSNGQLLTHSNHLGPQSDGEIHFHTPGKDIASLDLNEFLFGPGGVVDPSDAIGDY